MDENEHETNDNISETPATTTVEANQETEKAVADIKEDVDKREDAILQELRAIHTAINEQTGHHIRHLESHATMAAPVTPPTVEPAGATESENVPDEPVSLSIDEPKDLPKEKPEHKKSRKFGKRGKRA